MSSSTGGAEDFDEFRTRRWIWLPGNAWEVGAGAVMSFGLLEPYLFVRELGRVVLSPVTGHVLRIDYDASGNVTGASCDGETAANGAARPGASAE